MKKKILNMPVGLVFSSLTVLLLLPISAIAERDGGWTSTASPGHIFQSQEGLHNNQKHLVMTVLKPDLKGVEFYWGPTSESEANTYQLESMNGNSDMIATWRFVSDKEATVNVESCTTNCLWEAGQVVSFNKFFGDPNVYRCNSPRVPVTGQETCWDELGREIPCKGTGQDGEYQIGAFSKIEPGSGLFKVIPPSAGCVRFTDNYDGTMTDHITGLVWLVALDDCVPEAMNWTDALNFCNRLSSANCDDLTDGSKPGDWRLPSYNEIRSLVWTAGSMYDQCYPTPPVVNIIDNYCGGCFEDDLTTWTSTTHHTNQRAALFISNKISEECLYDAQWKDRDAFTDGYLTAWPVRSSK